MKRAVLVTARWGEVHGERGAVLRLLAGALAARAQVRVVSLLTSGDGRPSPTATGEEGPAGTVVGRDGVFELHELKASPAAGTRAGLLRAGMAIGGSRLPSVSGRHLVELAGGIAPEVPGLIASMEPDAVVLAGMETWWLPPLLAAEVPGVRVVSVPLLGDDAMASVEVLRPLFDEVEALGVLSATEARTVKAVAAPEPVELAFALAVNGSAAGQLMVGMSHFGRNVVVLTGFPEGAPMAPREPGPDFVRLALGPVAVAEVAGRRWSVSDMTQVRDVPVRPSRANLHKLLAHAEVCLDLRPQGLVGRETIESLLLGTPVVVPEGTVAAEHAERSNGGLWYRDYRELFAAARAILEDDSLRASLSSQGRAWARAVHGDHDRFVEQAGDFVFGSGAEEPALLHHATSTEK